MLDSDESSPSAPPEVPRADLPLTPEGSTIRKRPLSSLLQSLTHPRPIRRSTVEGFWTANLEIVPVFKCSPWDYYEPFLRRGRGEDVVLCNDQTEIRVMRTFATAPAVNYDIFEVIRHKNFQGFYELYHFEDTVYCIFEYVDFTIRDILCTSIRLTEVEIASIISQYNLFDRAFDALLDIPGLWGGMMITTLHKMMAMNCEEEILRYLTHVKLVWSDLVEHDKKAMQKIDQATVNALELRAPRASTLDAEALHSQIKGGKIFSDFTDAERERIWNQLQKVDGLIPSLYTFFKDLLYLQVCVDCIRRLTKLSSKQSLCDAMERKFTGENLPNGLVKIQVAENVFEYQKGHRNNQIDLGYRQLHAYAMRHYPDMPKEAVRENLVKQPTAKVDMRVLRGLADLASQLGFDSPEISALKQYPNTGTHHEYVRHATPLLVTTGPGVVKSQRCGKPHSRSFDEDRHALFINHLHDMRQDRSEGIASFFVRQSVYFAFFGRPVAFPINPTAPFKGLNESPIQEESPDPIEEDVDQLLSSYGASQDDSQEREKKEQERREKEKREQERREQKLRKQKRKEKDRQVRERQDQEKQEQERKEQERQELERREREKGDQEKHEQEKREQDKREQERREREKVRISFRMWERGIWRDQPSLFVHPANSIEVERIAKKYVRKNIRLLNTKLRMLTPKDCFRAALDSRTHTLLLVAQDDLVIDDAMLQSASRIHDEAVTRILGLKRAAENNDINKDYHNQKRRMFSNIT